MFHRHKNKDQHRILLITCYYNPNRYRSRYENFRTFAKKITEEGRHWRALELIFPGQSAQLTEYKNVISISGGDVLWQKERLLNLLIKKHAKKYDALAWTDSDILFENQNWEEESLAQLQHYPVVQPFSKVIRLPRGHRTWQGEGEEWHSFASVYKKSPQLLLKGDFEKHGHSGFIWLMRSDILYKHGLYDCNIAGSGDHVMSHAFTGDWDSSCITRIMSGNKLHTKHFETWAKKVYRDIKARVGFTPGNIWHLWHGETEHRRYVLRNRELAEFGFNPYKDIRKTRNGLWKWASNKQRLHLWAKEYFGQRREDGE